MTHAAVDRASAATGLIGRARERDRARELVEGGARLVTLTGPGGSGKTRLALALVDELRARYRDGAAVVELAPLREPSLVPTAIAQAVGLRESAGARVEEGLSAFFARREILLCVDNFEHVLDAAPLVSRLISQAPALTVIATSRAPLRLQDEQELPVPPLAPTDAEALFVRRAGQVRPDLALDNGAGETVAAICRRLDGLPLAIELAAARVRALSPPMLLARLEARLPLLTAVPRDVPERQRTLRATIEWSYELLPEPEKELFGRFSVFAGGCTLDAVEAVCGADLDALGSLVEQSLLTQEEAADGMRYAMLETIREYAAERLTESGAEDELRARHAAFFLELAEKAGEGIYGGRQLEWLDRLDVELPNLRSALSSSIEGQQAARALRLCTAILTFWESRRPSDGRRWLEAGLSAEDPVPPEVRARALIAHGHLTLFAGEPRRARDLLEAAEALSRKLGDAEGLTLALSRLSWVALEQGRLEESGSIAGEGLDLLANVTEPWVRAEALNYFGTAVAESNPERGCALLEQAHALWSDLGNVQRSADVLNNLGWVTILTGEYARSRAYHEQNLRVARGNKDTVRVLLALGNLGLVELLDGHPERVPLLLSEELPLMLERGERRTFPEAALTAASFAAAGGDVERSARLAGAGAAAYNANGGTWSQPEQQLLDRYVLPLRVDSEELFDRAWAEGGELSIEDAVSYALEGLSEPLSGAEPGALEDGESLAGYVLEEVVGRGGMGIVWRARQPSLDRAVAIKLIASEQAGDEAYRERFLREARLAASLEHPHVLPVYEAGETDGRLFLAMRYVEGEDLGSLLAREGPLEPGRAVALTAQVASALDAAHAKGLVHRDVKPANVLVLGRENGEHAYLTDFGIAKGSATDSAGITAAGQLLGTVEYLAPETIQRGEAGPASDIYALACVLYELLTGFTPFARETDVATIWAHVQEEPRPLGNRFPAALDAVVRRGLAKRPSERFQSAGELAREASAAIADPGRWIAAPPPVESWPQGLPRPATRLVGRDRELAELAAALSNGSGGLLTITGPGGTGKTRLALELAARIAARFADGVHFVALAPVRDPSLVASTIAQAIGLRESGVLSLEELVEQRLREGELLLLLDNVEHLVPAASPLLSRLARAIHGSRLVLTSRAAVGVSGEQEYPLEPLSEPDAARLFEERARAVKPSLELDTEAATIVASICNKLDGLPLAIELAAARVRLMSPKAILARLDERLAILTGGPVDAPARQQTLRATIDWSYRLLEPEEQRLFAGLSAFPGGARLEAIEAVLDTDLDSLDALMRQSLLVARDDPDGEPRFAMLETIREYAAEQLEASGHDNELRHSQAAYVLKLAELADLYGAEELLWLDRLETEHDNIRAALTFALEHDAATALRIAAAVWYFWWTRGHLHEGRERLESALAATSEPALAHAIARFGNAILTRDLGEEEKSLQMSRENVSLFEALGNRWWLGEAFLALATLERMRGDRAAAEEYFDRAIAIARDDHEDFVLGEALSNLGTLEVDEGHFADAACHLEEAVAAWERLGSPSGLALAQSNLGCALVALGELERSEELMRQGLQAFAELRNPHMFCSVLDELGIGVALARGDEPRAARLLGGRDRLGRELALEREWHTKPETVQRVREELGPDTYEAAYAEGRAMSLDQLVACAIGHEAQAQQRTARPT